MRISHRCEYALRALLELARSAEVGAGPVRIDDIARRGVIPRKFLANVLVHLKRGHFVESKKGPEGGYYLARPARQIPIGEVVRFVEGPIAPIACVSPARGEKCVIAGRCGYRPLWRRVREAVAEIVDGTTLEQVLEEARQNELEEQS